MNIKILLKLTAVSGFCYFFTSCNKNTDLPAFSDSDLELQNVLAEASGGKGFEYYILPNETDFQKIPQDVKNPLTAEKVELGKLLFHETGLGQNPIISSSVQTYSCASCHHAKAGFQACVPQGIGEGGIGYGIQGEKRIVDILYKTAQIDVQPIRTPSALNIAYQSNILWNGQFGGKDLNIGTESNWTKGTPKAVNELGYSGVETQAIAGRDVHRLLIDRIFMSHFSTYKSMYEKAFGAESFNNPKLLALNGALAIAAYERTLLANRSPFQQWLRGNANAMTDQEKEGAKVFFSKGNCYSCHNGPSLANMEFHALGMNDLKNGSYGANTVQNISDANPEHKGRGGFTGRQEDLYRFKVPQLYNLKDSPFYGHGASFTNIKEVLDYKNKGVPQNVKVPANKISDKFKPLNLSDDEILALEAFIKNGLYDHDLERYAPKSLPSGLAFPNNDKQSRLDLGF
jgi:cytochrome c peroxidase